MNDSSDLIVFVRIAMYAGTGALIRGGWLPEGIAGELTSPETVEAVAGLAFGAGALLWYWVSKARKVLKEAVT